ncbi:MAG: TIM barrel protein, partial [Clostridia bacterium]
DEMIEKSFGYVIKSLNYLRAIRGEHCVFHPACMGKLKREEAISLTTSRLNELVSKVYENNLDDMFLCPETMGKSAQIGTYKEIVNFCTIDKLFVPCFDFGHINALEGGTLKSEKDFKKVFDYAFSKLDEDKVKKCHIHFSKIQFGDKGEIRHLDFSDEIYGPNYEALANVINEYNLSPHMICESSSKMSEDALVMKKYLMTSQ